MNSLIPHKVSMKLELSGKKCVDESPIFLVDYSTCFDRRFWQNSLELVRWLKCNARCILVLLRLRISP